MVKFLFFYLQWFANWIIDRSMRFTFGSYFIHIIKINEIYYWIFHLLKLKFTVPFFGVFEARTTFPSSASLGE